MSIENEEEVKKEEGVESEAGDTNVADESEAGDTNVADESETTPGGTADSKEEADSETL